MDRLQSVRGRGGERGWRGDVEVRLAATAAAVAARTNRNRRVSRRRVGGGGNEPTTRSHRRDTLAAIAETPSQQGLTHYYWRERKQGKTWGEGTCAQAGGRAGGYLEVLKRSGSTTV